MMLPHNSFSKYNRPRRNPMIQYSYLKIVSGKIYKFMGRNIQYRKDVNFSEISIIIQDNSNQNLNRLLLELGD